MLASALVIEDDQLAQDIFARMLEVTGFNITTIDQGDTALHYLTTHDPDLIILDMKLPVVSGGEILDYIRTEDRLQNAILIIVSDYELTSRDLKQADHVMPKPTKPSHFIPLLNNIKHFLENNETSD